ncbi:hypothetical protein FSP39_020114 [Pinctada imbricata]|uniref:CUB domain-containing protein n=1 Tax=Pinctada imbricata TaxID=66713 RepID=A0AA88YRZ9_PINIB|nr:hypothetical protein FSP39_020114 [Pinctada imbricata]
MSEFLSLRRLLLALLRVACVVAFTTTVDFESDDCGGTFNVQSYDQYRVKAQPLATPAGGADHCKVTFTSAEPFRIYVQDFHTNDCTVTLKFYENDPSQTREKYTLGCPPHEPPSSRVWTTESGTLIVRLDKSSGTTTSYQFELLISIGSNALSATGGGGAITTGAIIGIIVGVVAFLIIIIALVLYFVCKQMREKKEERMRQMEAQSPPVFTTVTSQEYDARYRSEPDRNNGTWSRRERERERERERHEREVEQPRLSEPKVNGILKNSPGRRRRRRDDTSGGGGYDNDGYTPSVSSTDGSEFDYETYRKGIEQGLPSGTAKNFSLNPDPPKDRRDRRERRRQESRNEYRSDFRSASQTSDSSADEDGYVNPAFTDDRGNTRRSASLGKVSGRSASKYAESESSRRSVDDTASAFTRSTTGSYRSRTRSYSPSRTDGSRDSSDTGTSITTGSGSRFQRNPNDASIRRSRSRSQSRTGSAPRRKHHPQVHDPSQQQGHGHHQPHQHHHRSRSRDRKKDAYLPVFADAKKIQKMQKK